MELLFSIRPLPYLYYIIFILLVGSSNKPPTRQQAIVYTILQPEYFDILYWREIAPFQKSN